MITRLFIFAFLSSAAFSAHATSATHPGMSWFGKTLMSSIIHGLIYGVIYKLFRQLGLVGCVAVAIIGLSIAFLIWNKLKSTT